MSEADRASPSPRLGMNCSSDGCAAGGDQVAAGCALPLLAGNVRVKRRGFELGPLLGRRDPPQQLVQGRERVRCRLRARLLDQRRELDQLEEPCDGLVDVLGRVEAHLGQGRACAPGGLEHLVAQHPVGRVEPLRRAEQLLLVDLLLDPSASRAAS